MAQIPNSVADILKSKTTRGLPRPVDYGTADVASHVQGNDNFHRVFAIRPGEHVVMLTDPLLDPRVVQAVYGLARARGATFTSYMGPSTRLMAVPDEARALVERADFVVSTWFASVIDPFCIDLRRDKGQRWIKITFFRNLDLLQTPQARFPLDILGEIIRASSRAYPDTGAFDLRFGDARGTNVVVRFTEEMRKRMKADNRWRGHNIADEDGCYIHFLPTHGPNLYEVKMVGGSHVNPHMPVNGILYPQWAVGFERPFEEKIGVEFKDGRVARHSWQQRRGAYPALHRRRRARGAGLRPQSEGAALRHLSGRTQFAGRAAFRRERARAVRLSAARHAELGRAARPHGSRDLRHHGHRGQPGGDRGRLSPGAARSRGGRAARRYGDPVDLLESFPV